MSEQVEAKGGMMQPTMPTMVAPTFMQRLCDLLHQRITVSLNCPGAAPVAGMLHAVGQDYIELHNGTSANTQATIIPLWNVCAVQVAGAMDQICPPPQPYPGMPQYPVSPGMGMGPGMMPGCPKPGDCPPPGWPISPGMGMGPMPGGPMMPPGMMEVKDVKEEEKEK
ncbi:hypothetical protein [Desulforamulus putei]|uniref:Uncharacterized protein n=1 Tax=Desulforamulus putei DSM 12395 TaxID=1121429 RepID=A0A1M5AVP1_9FIRM|nr:hypothetical protein [Desulforamulus putei]SHF34331.1 hypothetical protein SAMN02745133_02396 [Desulforamulus putei DSM 12395]